MTKLFVSEIFFGLQGETSRQGLPTVFVRLAGCNLRCAWCDTKYAYDEGRYMSIDEVFKKINSYRRDLVEFTGGEPMLQWNVLAPLVKRLLAKKYQIMLETNGSMDISRVPKKVIKILDIKCPSSGEEKSNNFGNLKFLTEKDEIKFVIANRKDYEWARKKVAVYALNSICPVLFSPTWKKISPETLARWILKDNLPVRLQLQLHKIIWGEKRGA